MGKSGSTRYKVSTAAKNAKRASRWRKSGLTATVQGQNIIVETPKGPKLSGLTTEFSWSGDWGYKVFPLYYDPTTSKVEVAHRCKKSKIFLLHDKELNDISCGECGFQMPDGLKIFLHLLLLS